LILYLLFRKYLAFMERGRRRLELIKLWLDRALKARAAHAAQANTERVTRAWAAILTRTPPRVASPPAEGQEPDAAGSPLAMQLGHPVVHEADLDEWLAEAGAQPGWRYAFLQDAIVASAGVNADRAVGWLAADPALPGGRIARFAKAMDQSLRAVGQAKADAVAVAVKARLATAQSVRVRMHAGVPEEQFDAGTFLAQVTSEKRPDDWPDDSRHSWVLESAAGAPPKDLALSEALCRARLRLQIKESPVPPPAPDSGDGAAAAHEDTGGVR
jgi:hypothetical protein